MPTLAAGRLDQTKGLWCATGATGLDARKKLMRAQASQGFRTFCCPGHSAHRRSRCNRHSCPRTLPPVPAPDASGLLAAASEQAGSATAATPRQPAQSPPPSTLATSLIPFRSTPPQRHSDAVSHKAGQIGQAKQIARHDQRIAPAVGFTLDHRQGGDAVGRKHKPHQHRQRSGQ